MSETYELTTIQKLRGPELMRARQMRLQANLGDEHVRNQLFAKSRYEHIWQSTPRDLWDPKRGFGRFANQDSLERWLTTHDFNYPLVDGAHSLVGLVWFRPETLPDRGQQPLEGKGSSHTFATRLYEYRGRGLASPFYDLAIKQLVDDLHERGELDSLTGISLETAMENVPARKSYERTGWDYTHTGYSVDILRPDGSSYSEERALMEMMPEAIDAAYRRAEQALAA